MEAPPSYQEVLQEPPSYNEAISDVKKDHELCLICYRFQKLDATLLCCQSRICEKCLIDMTKTKLCPFCAKNPFPKQKKTKVIIHIGDAIIEIPIIGNPRVSFIEEKVNEYYNIDFKNLCALKWNEKWLLNHDALLSDYRHLWGDIVMKIIYRH